MIKREVDNPTFIYEDAYGHEWEYYHVNFWDVIKTFYGRHAKLSEIKTDGLITHINESCFLISTYEYYKAQGINTEALARDIRFEGLGCIRVLRGYIKK